MNSSDIIILGSGIVGKTAALALSQKGLKVLHLANNFVPQSPIALNDSDQSAWDQRVYAISDSSEALFRSLNVWNEIPAERVQAVLEMFVFGDSGKNSDKIHFSAFETAVPKLASIIEATQIEKALDLASKFSKNLERRESSHSAVNVTPEAAEIHTDQGIFTAPLVIAADGARSPTRESLGIEVSTDTYDHSAVVANFSCSQTHLQGAYQWFLENGDVLALLPLPDKKVSLVWSTQHAFAQELIALSLSNPVAFCHQVTEAANGQPSHYLGTLSLLSQAKSFPIQRMKVGEVIAPIDNPRVVLMGDAAHTMHPLAGQGLNLGLRDVSDFLKLLSEKESFRKLGDKVLMRRYERMRAGDTQAILSVTHGLHRLFLKPDHVVRWMRNTGLRVVNQNPFIKQQLTQHALR